METRWHVAKDDADWLRQALAFIAAAEARALAERGAFHIVLAGGGTPRRVYAALAREAHDWPRWQVWFGDERCLPPDDPERNSRMALDTWLERVNILPAQIHVMHAQTGGMLAAAAYDRELAGVGDFDLVLLGLGEDGHTASLFPGHDWGGTDDAPDTLAVSDAPKPPPGRVSLSARRLGRARQVLFLATGAGKRTPIAAWRAGQPIPAAAIRPDAGVDVLIDTAAQPEGASS